MIPSRDTARRAIEGGSTTKRQYSATVIKVALGVPSARLTHLRSRKRLIATLKIDRSHYGYSAEAVQVAFVLSDLFLAERLLEVAAALVIERGGKPAERQRRIDRITEGIDE